MKLMNILSSKVKLFLNFKNYLHKFFLIISKSRMYKKFYLSIFVILIIYTLYLSINRPLYNWDIIGYIGAAKYIEEKDYAVIQSFTYNKLKSSVPDEIYNDLINGVDQEYRQKVYKHSEIFKEQLNFYQIRIIYVWLIFLLFKLGIDIVFATHFISGISIVLSLIILYKMSLDLLKVKFIYFIPVTVIYFGLLDLSKLSTPDALSALAIILSAYFYLKRYLNVLLIFLPIIIGIRNDLIFFTLFLLGIIYLFNETSRKKTLLSLIFSLIVFFTINKLYGFSWSTLIYHTFINRVLYPISNPPVLSLQDYLVILINESEKSIVKLNRFKIFFLPVLGILYYFRAHIKFIALNTFLSAFSLRLVAVCFLYLLIHFALFPIENYRFFPAFYIVGIFSIIIIISEREKIICSFNSLK